MWLDGWIKLRCAGLISSYVKHLKGLFNLFLNEFFDLSIFALNHRDVHMGPIDYEALAHDAKETQSSVFIFFGDQEAVRRRNALISIVKRLVELEGHLL